MRAFFIAKKAQNMYYKKLTIDSAGTYFFYLRLTGQIQKFIKEMIALWN
jgi:hypothetical protein